MKFERLELTAFGRFSGQVFDFEQQPAALHVVYGNNEAGKSTALRAIRGLLFGIPALSQDTFLHAGADLRIDATIVSAGQRLTFTRRKGRKNTLLDASGQPLGEDVLAGFIGGVDQGLFDAMFGLDHDRLRDGALGLLAMGGKVGASLFGASLGAAHLQRALGNLRLQAEELFTARGRSRPLNLEIDNVRKARELFNTQATPPHVYVEHRAELSRVQQEAEAVSEKRRHFDAKRRELELVRRLLPLVAQRNAYVQQLQTLGHVPMLPENAEQDVAAAVAAHNDAEKRHLHASREVQRVHGLLASRTLDASLLAIPEDTIRQLTEQLGSARKAKVDLPKRQGELDAAYAEIRVLLKRLGHEFDLDKLALLRLSKDEEAWLRSLSRERTRYDTRLTTQSDKLSRAELSLHSLKRALAKLPEEVDVRALDGALIRAQKHAELEAQLDRAKAQLDVADKRVGALAERLRPWCVEELKSSPLTAALWNGVLPITKDVCFQFARKRQASEERWSAFRAETAEIAERQVEARHALVAEESARELPSDQGLAELRQRRDTALEHLGQLLLPGARERTSTPEERSVQIELVRERVRAADSYVDSMRLHAAQLAQLRTRHERVREMDARLVARRAREQELQAEVAELDDQWVALWGGSVFLVQPPERMLGLLDLLDEREALLTARSDAQTAVRRLERALAEVVAELSSELARVGENGRLLWETLPQFVARLEGVVQARKDSNQKRRDTVQRLAMEQEQADEAERELKQLKESSRTLKSEWLRATKRLGLSKEAGPEAVGATLDALVDVFHRVDEANALERRIAGIERDARELNRSIAEVAAHLRPELGISADLPGLERLLAAYQREAEVALEHRRLVDEAKQRERALQQAELELEQATQTLHHWFRLADVTNVEELTRVMSLVAQRRRLQDDLADEERKIIAAGEGQNLPELCARCEGQSSAALQQELALLSEQAQSLEGSWEELTRQRVHLEQALEKLSVGAVQASEELAGQVAKLQSSVRKYLRLRLASTLVDREIERYRSDNQGPVLNRVQELFPRLTLGRYQGVRVDFSETDEPKLLCVNGDGRSVELEALSDGTRDQLYLSLRVATLEQYFRTNPALPFVLDDAFIHFDDDRAKAALRVLIELANSTQVLFFTHHRRMLELLRDSAGEFTDGVVVHELNDGGTKGAV